MHIENESKRLMMMLVNEVNKLNVSNSDRTVILLHVTSAIQLTLLRQLVEASHHHAEVDHAKTSG